MRLSSLFVSSFVATSEENNSDLNQTNELL